MAAVTEGTEPWARGGAMSDHPDQPAPSVRRSGRPLPQRPRRSLVVAIAVAAALAVTVTITVLASQPESSEPQATPTQRIEVPDATLPPVSSPEQAVTDPNVELEIETLIGTVTWSRVDGDTSSLPERITDAGEAAFFGESDESTRRLISIDGGQEWSDIDPPTVFHYVDGYSWAIRVVDDRRVLYRLDGSEVPAFPTNRRDDDVPEGITITTDLATGPANGFPIDLDGETFVLTRRRRMLPWTEILGEDNLGPDGAYRVQLNTAGESLSAASGDFHEMSVTVLTLRPIDDTGRFNVVNNDGEVVWTVDLGPEPLISSADDQRLRNLIGVAESTWSMWTGEQFERVPTPWSASDQLEIVAVDGGVLARSIGVFNRDAALWRSSNGLDWERVDLPAERVVNTPVQILAGDADDAILTFFTRHGLTQWVTVDGKDFDALPDVRGIERRSRGTFGWVAPDPRSFPRISVSADGETWEQIDLGGLLGVEGSFWDLSIDVRAIGPRLFVVAERDGTRTLLIGEVRQAA